MSASLVPIKTIMAIDPTIDFDPSEYQYLITKSGEQNTYTQINAITATNAGSQFNNLPPSTETALDRAFLVQYDIAFTFSGNNATPGTNLIQLGSNDALKYMPLNSKLFKTISITLNNGTSSINSNQVIPALCRSNMKEDHMESDLSMSPCSIYDMTQNYEDLLNPAVTYNERVSLNMNPLGPIGQGKYDGRGGFYVLSRVKIDDDNEVITYRITEPLMVSPLSSFFTESCQGLMGVNQYGITIVHDVNAVANNICSMWAHSSYGNTLTAIRGDVLAARLLLRQITLPSTMAVPRGLIMYPFSNILNYITNIGVVNSLDTFSGQSNNIQLPAVPSRIFLYAKEKVAVQNYNSTDTFGRLSNISIQLFNKAGLLAGATEEQLYTISVKNGLKNVSYTQWKEQLGSLIILNPSQDLGLSPDLADGVGNIQTQLIVQYTLTNINQTKNIDFEFNIVIVQPGIYTIDAGAASAYQTTNIVTRSDVMNATTLNLVDYNIAKSFIGGDFMGRLQQFGRNVYDVAKKVSPYVRQGVNLAQKALPYVEKAIEYAPAALSLVGLGEDEYMGEGRRRKKKRVVRRR